MNICLKLSCRPISVHGFFLVGFTTMPMFYLRSSIKNYISCKRDLKKSNFKIKIFVVIFFVVDVFQVPFKKK